MIKTEDNLAGNSKLSCANCGRAKGDHFVGYKEGPHLWCPDNSKREFQSSLDRIAALEQQLAAAKPYQEFVEWAQHDALHGNCGLESCPLRSHCMKQQRPIACWAVADAWQAWQERKGK